MDLEVMAEDLYAKLEAVADRDSFLAFVRAPIADREDEVAKEKINPNSPWGAGANGWENGTIEAYLEAAVACAEASIWNGLGNASRGFVESIRFLYCGKG